MTGWIDSVAREASHARSVLAPLLYGVMAVETHAANQAVLDRLSLQQGDRVLEIGFGHGRTLAEIARRSGAKHVAGIDVSAKSLRMARLYNYGLAFRGRLDLRVGDVQQLPWKDGAFDAALGVHTLYFWRDVGAALTEIRRVLRPGGRLALGFVSADERPDPQRYPSDVYRFQKREVVADALAAAGFTEIAVERIEIRPKPISIALARTPDLLTPPGTDSPPRS